MKVRELIIMLLQYDSDKEIVITWHGMDAPFDIYTAADGRIVIDADNNIYKVDYQETKCEVCGELANGLPHGKPRCCDHWIWGCSSVG